MIIAQIDWRMEREMEMGEKKKENWINIVKGDLGIYGDCLVVMKFGYKLI